MSNGTNATADWGANKRLGHPVFVNFGKKMEKVEQKKRFYRSCGI